MEKEAQELADSSGVKIFQADIIYHLFDKFTAYREELKQKKREEFKQIAVFPCKLKVSLIPPTILQECTKASSKSVEASTSKEQRIEKTTKLIRSLFFSPVLRVCLFILFVRNRFCHNSFSIPEIQLWLVLWSKMALLKKAHQSAFQAKR